MSRLGELELKEAAREAAGNWTEFHCFAWFRKSEIEDPENWAIIYTHNHADHIFGAGVLAGDDHPEVIAHSTFQAELDRNVMVTRPILWKRSMRHATRISCRLAWTET